MQSHTCSFPTSRVVLFDIMQVARAPQAACAWPGLQHRGGGAPWWPSKERAGVTLTAAPNLPLHANLRGPRDTQLLDMPDRSS